MKPLKRPLHVCLDVRQPSIVELTVEERIQLEQIIEIGDDSAATTECAPARRSRAG